MRATKSQRDGLIAALRNRLSLVVLVSGVLCLSPPARGDDYPAANLPQGTCVGGPCHGEVKVDPRHAGKHITCNGCHPNVVDNRQPHKGALDALPPERMCALSGCHADTVAAHAGGLHKDSPCEACHDSLHGDFKPHNYEPCKDCHEDEVNALAKSAHAIVRPGKDPVDCANCHGDLHAPRAKGDPLSPVSKVLQITTCSECHDKEYVRAYRQSVHGQGLLRSGLAVAPACTDCHGTHDIQKVKDPRAKVSRDQITATCGACHQFIVARWKQSAHGRVWTDEVAVKKGEKAQKDGPLSSTSEDHPREAPVCTSCHSGHRTFDPTIYGNNLRMADRCGECHKRHSESYRDSFHGKAARLGYGPAATCAGCHTPHDMQPTADERSSVNGNNLVKTCGACHEGAGASFVRFDAHMDARDPKRNPTVHMVWLFMTALLLGVLGFFALHTALWLQRSIVALARGEFHQHGLGGSEWIRRFKPTFMWIHVAIILSFLLLAATGLPLKFSGVAWARPIETIFGGLGNARWLHRLAGVLTFGYAFAYLAYLIREVGLRRRTEILWGWRSMVPSGKDLTDLIGNLRWFLYLGPPPRLDRWAYWEKFDFFAVFWGIPVIGLSGLCLWMPLWVTHVLPGWALNIAFLVHSDEALLATGFIFFFHFFHTHLRPESFPLDTVMFLGGMPLERFRAERPVEYARLVESGEIEALRMPAPGPADIRRARVFGFVTLGLGIVLGAVLLGVGVHALLR